MNARHAIRPILFSLAAILALAAQAAAQDVALRSAPASLSPAPVVADSAAPAVGPTRDAATLAVRPVSETNHNPAPPPARSGFSHGEVWMIVGGAAILTGIVIGGDAGHAISIGGAVVGLIGLYQYLQ